MRAYLPSRKFLREHAEPWVEVGSIVITPNEYQSFVRSVHAAVMQLAEDQIQQEAPGLPAYERWINTSWGPFFRSNESDWESFLGSAFAANLERAETLRQEYAEFRAIFEAAGGRPTGPAPEAANLGSPSTGIPTALLTGLIVGGVAAIGLAIYFGSRG